MLKLNNFKNVGYLQHTFNSEDLDPVLKEIEKIQSDFLAAKSSNKNLAGNIEHEYVLEECLEHVENLISKFIPIYSMNFGYKMSNMTKPHKLTSLWVNYQKKHEFNPAHTHTGEYSFVIWIKIPYNIHIEKVRNSSINSNTNVPGHFEFQYTNCLGNIQSEYIPADSSMENTMLLFPSELRHSVAPFYTSDDYRISISGNFNLL